MLKDKTKLVVERDKWIHDPGAKVHAVNDLKWFNDFHDFDMKVSVADEVNLAFLEKKLSRY